MKFFAFYTPFVTGREALFKGVEKNKESGSKHRPFIHSICPRGQPHTCILVETQRQAEERGASEKKRGSFRCALIGAGGRKAVGGRG